MSDLSFQDSRGQLELEGRMGTQAIQVCQGGKASLVTPATGVLLGWMGCQVHLDCQAMMAFLDSQVK